MIDLIEKSLLTGLGALALTQQKAEELAAELKRKLNLGEEKGQELLKLLSDTARSNQRNLEEIAREEVRRACADIGLVNKEELNRLVKKIQHLEKELGKLRRAEKNDSPSAC
jgi:polyhydroxyalkanoate synthesis regulator phasin